MNQDRLQFDGPQSVQRLAIQDSFPRDRKSMMQPARSMRRTRRGVSLLEVILALAILAMSATMLGQVTFHSTDNALMAKRIANAQILCESKMSEVLSGAIPLQPVDWTLVDDGTIPGQWYYRLDSSTTERPNMVGIRLSVTDDPNKPQGNPELFFLVRWVIDPNLGLDTPPTTEGTGTASSGASSSTGSASTGTGAGGIQ